MGKLKLVVWRSQTQKEQGRGVRKPNALATIKKNNNNALISQDLPSAATLQSPFCIPAWDLFWDAKWRYAIQTVVDISASVSITLGIFLHFICPKSPITPPTSAPHMVKYSVESASSSSFEFLNEKQHLVF